MILHSNVFINSNDNNIFKDSRYLYYFLSSIIDSNGLNLDYIFSILINNYGEDTIDYLNLKKYLSDNFGCLNDIYYSKNRTLVTYANNYEKCIRNKHIKLVSKNNKEPYFDVFFNKDISYGTFEYMRPDYLAALYLDFLVNKSKYKKLIITKIHSLPQDILKRDISKLFSNKVIVNQLKVNGIETINDFFYNYDRSYKTQFDFSLNYILDINEYLESLDDLVNDNDVEINEEVDSSNNFTPIEVQSIVESKTAFKPVKFKGVNTNVFYSDYGLTFGKNNPHRRHRPHFSYFNELNLNDDNYCYSDAYLRFIITKLLYENDFLTKEEIAKKLKSLDCYKKEKFNEQFEEFLDDNFNYQDDGYYLENKLEIAWVLNLQNYIENSDFKKEKFNLNDYLKYNPVSVQEGIIAYILNACDDISLEMLSKIYDLFSNYNDYYLDLDCSLNKLDAECLDYNINVLFNNKIILECLDNLEIKFIKDLKLLSIESLLILSVANYKKMILILKSISNNQPFKDAIYSIYDKLKSNYLDILLYRHDYLNNRKLRSLEEVGNYYGLTRERVRQIEVKALDIIKLSIKASQEILVNTFFKISEGNIYLKFSELLDSFKSEVLVNKYLIILDYYKLIFKVDKDLKLIYLDGALNLEELMRLFSENYGYNITNEQYLNLSENEQNIIDKFYRKDINNVYVYRSFSITKIILDTIDDLFPQGYRISNDEQYELLKKTVKERYGIISFPEQRAVSSYLERFNYCLIARGTYLNRKYCIELPESFVEEVIDFIQQNKPIIAYANIFDEFKDQLSTYGVDNEDYLKGIIDEYLPADCITNRNSISVGDTNISFSKYICDYMHSLKRFNLEDLKAKFKGSRDSVLFNYCYKEIPNGLIAIKSTDFIYLDSLDISDETLRELKEFIDNLFVTLDTSFLSAKKVYARLKLTRPKLLEALKCVNDSFSIFSFINAAFYDKYGFDRPLIKLNVNDKTDTNTATINYAKTLDQFDNRIIGNFINKMNIKPLSSYLKFMEDLSSDYVQVDVKTMVKKDKFNFSNEDLNKIKNVFNLIFSRFDLINTKNFNAYFMLPTLKYQWNKYLLAGVVRSYLSDLYSVENTENNYAKTDFIIKKIER